MIKKFLLTDDDLDDVELFREALSDIDSSISCNYANDGKEAIEKLRNKKVEDPQIIFLDVNMPEMNGWECLSILKQEERFKDIPVIMYSTSSSKQDAQKALALGALCFYEKPNNFKLLRNFLDLITHTSPSSLHEKLMKAEQLKSYRIFVSPKI
jgi:CheY-like chemotaxis protein